MQQRQLFKNFFAKLNYEQVHNLAQLVRARGTHNAPGSCTKQQSCPARTCRCFEAGSLARSCLAARAWFSSPALGSRASSQRRCAQPAGPGTPAWYAGPPPRWKWALFLTGIPDTSEHGDARDLPGACGCAARGYWHRAAVRLPRYAFEERCVHGGRVVAATLHHPLPPPRSPTPQAAVQGTRRSC